MDLTPVLSVLFESPIPPIAAGAAFAALHAFYTRNALTKAQHVQREFILGNDPAATPYLNPKLLTGAVFAISTVFTYFADLAFKYHR